MKKKVLYMTNLPTPYKIDFFEELGKYIDLTVTFERRTANNRDSKWLSTKCEGFNAVYMRGKKCGIEGAICPQIIKIIKDGPYDTIIVGTYYTPTGMLAIEYMNIAGIHYCISVDGGFVKNDRKFKFRIKKHFLKGADKYFSPGKKTDEYLIYYGVILQKIIRYPFASKKKEEILEEPLNYENKNEIRTSLGMHEKKIIIGVGQFIYRKGWDILLQAAYGLGRQVGVYIIGGKPTDEYLKIKKRLSLEQVHFIDFMGKDELKKYYLAADVFVLPTREDIWGLVINEAMGYGIPVVTTKNCMAGLEMVKDEINGYLVENENIDMLQKSVEAIIYNEELQRKMSFNAIDTAKKYTIENMAKHYIEDIICK